MSDRCERYSVMPGTSIIHLLRCSTPSSIACDPSGTLTVDVQITEAGSFQSIAGLTLHNNLSGTISTKTRDVLMGPAYSVKFTAISDVAIVEIAQ